MRLNKASDMTSVIMLSVVMLNVIMLNVVMLNVVMLSVAILNVLAPEKAIECLDNKNKKKFSVLELML